MTDKLYSVVSSLTSYFNTDRHNSLLDNKLLNISTSITDILGNNSTFSIPQLVVVGTQSSGKSSLLNSIIGLDILPTGTNMVTRTPLSLQLINSPKNIAELGYYHNNVFKKTSTIDLKDTKNLVQVSDEIENITVTLAGSKKNISGRSIIMKVYYSSVPNLHLIDLPGLTMVACTDQGQPKDIKTQIRSLVTSYIKKPKTIILAVIQARTDVEADLGLDLIKEYDPSGSRTIGVLTKVDLMNTNNDISDYLKNNISSDLKLRYGYFAIRNKGSSEADSIPQILEGERVYFDQHPIYSKLEPRYKSQLGIGNLSNYISGVLLEHITNSLPSLVDDINSRNKIITSRLIQLGSGIPSKKEEQVSCLNIYVTQFNQAFINSINHTDGINYGIKIKDLFDTFKDEVKESAYNFEFDYIKDVIRSCSGNHLISIPSIEIIEHCLRDPDKKPIDIFIEPCVNLVNKMIALVKDLVLVILESNNDISRFKKLSDFIKNEIYSNLVLKYQKGSRAKILELIEVESAYIWTCDEVFIKNLQKFFGGINLSNMKGDSNIKNIIFLLNAYLDTVKLSIINQAPKILMHNFIGNLEKNMCTFLLETVSRKIDKIGDYFVEDPKIDAERRRLINEGDQINKILKLLTGV